MFPITTDSEQELDLLQEVLSDFDATLARLTGWSCPWAVHQHINGNGVLCSWHMTKYVYQHG
jgi:hypothetical protein